MMYQFSRIRKLGALLALSGTCVLFGSVQGQVLTHVEVEFDGSGGVRGLTGARDVAVSPDGEHVYVIGSLPIEGGSIAVFSRNTDDQLADFGKVTFIEALFDDGLFFSASFTTARATNDEELRSPGHNLSNGQVVDLASDGILPTGLPAQGFVVERTDDTFKVSLTEGGAAVTFTDDGTGTHTWTNLGTIAGLRGPRAVTVSPDGKHVYVVALSDGSVVVFSRNDVPLSGDFGKLTHVETIVDAGSGPTDNGLQGAHGVIVSADGKHVYVCSRAEDAVTVFSRNESTGQLLHIEAHFDGNAGVSGLKDAERLTLSPDGKHLYVASEDGDTESPGAIAVFSRNMDELSGDFGKLTFVESKIDGVNGADGLLNANDVAVSPDGKHVYVSNRIPGTIGFPSDGSDDWLATYSRDEVTGSLTFVSKLVASAFDSCSSVFLNGGIAGFVVVSPDGKTVVASNPWQGSVVSFSRDSETGVLTIGDEECDELGDEGIVTINAVTMSPDGKHVYTTGLGAPASLVFLRLEAGMIQPDGHIGKKSTALTGDGVYNTTGVGQKLTVVSKKLKSVKFFGKFENDGDIGDRISLQGTKKNRDFKLIYLLDGANVTAAIAVGTSGKVLNPGDSQSLLVKGKPSRKLKDRRTGKIKRKKRNVTITGISEIDGTKRDVVRGLVKAK